jgi:hypothetical protein
MRTCRTVRGPECRLRVSRFGRWFGLLSLLPLLVLGCVKQWARPGGSRAEFEQDRAHCERVASLRGGLLQHESRFDRCMEARGYRRR